ncbi:MAG: carboxypeptidase-like regulatory domain-containing protein [Candidatus Delongbacteria bacterium]|jgi:hypothetical protein|nr:carboxypeptidase-like regulatory domain-containing protein [Candidatus Delongbacteria bacterium]
MKKFLQMALSLLSVLLLLQMISCSDDDNPTSPPTPIQTAIKIVVKSSLDSSMIQNSNVVIFSAETKEAYLRDLSDADGNAYFDCEEGNYYVELAAQGFDPSPAPNVTPIPFYVMEHDTTTKTYYLNSNPVANSSYVLGLVEPAVNNVLIQAVASSGTEKYATVSGPDGFFILYNLPDNDYSYQALKSGFKLDTVTVIGVTTPLYPDGLYDSLTVEISPYAGSALSGSVSFLATTDTLDVDIVLRDPITMAVIPGMITREIGGNYSLDSIPDGDFIAWASFENDGYVMDPDWIFKNPDGLDLSFPTNNTPLNFSLTGSINMISPTNPADSIYAFEADSLVPTFSWGPYPSTKEWIIEVRDLNGNVIWGGFDASGIVQHQQISKDTYSIEYNFDGSASANLVPGNIYQWKIYADDDTALNVQTLISSSEDLRGIFTVPEGK